MLNFATLFNVEVEVGVGHCTAAGVSYVHVICNFTSSPNAFLQFDSSSSPYLTFLKILHS